MNRQILIFPLQLIAVRADLMQLTQSIREEEQRTSKNETSNQDRFWNSSRQNAPWLCLEDSNRRRPSSASSVLVAFDINWDERKARNTYPIHHQIRAFENTKECGHVNFSKAESCQAKELSREICSIRPWFRIPFLQKPDSR